MRRCRLPRAALTSSVAVRLPPFSARRRACCARPFARCGAGPIHALQYVSAGVRPLAVLRLFSRGEDPRFRRFLAARRDRFGNDRNRFCRIRFRHRFKVNCHAHPRRVLVKRGSRLRHRSRLSDRRQTRNAQPSAGGRWIRTFGSAREGYRPELSSVIYVPETVRVLPTNIRSRPRWWLLSSCTRTPNGRLATGGGRDSLSAALTSRE